MRLSELIAHGERLVDTVRDLRRGTKPADASAPAIQELGRTVATLKAANDELQQEVIPLKRELREYMDGYYKLQVMESQAMDRVKELSEQAKRDHSEIMVLKDRAESADRRTKAHRDTIMEYYNKLHAELGSHGKTASTDSDS